MSKETRLIVGSAPADDVVRTIYEQLGDMDEFIASVALTTLAAALKFGGEPQEMLRELAEKAPYGAYWLEEVKPALESQVHGSDPLDFEPDIYH